MRLALKLARQGVGRPSSEPLVGAVVVAGQRAVGHGHAGPGVTSSAVILAMEEAGPLGAQSTIYTNMEPCGDSRDIEQCLARLIALGPRRIVIGGELKASSKRGGEATSSVISRLKAAGIDVETGLCSSECREANAVYFKYAETGLPFVTIKFAASLDGRIATSTGDSQWISGNQSLKLAHRLRREHDAILVGIGTVLRDDPKLTVRLVNGRSPLRVIVDSRLRVPLRAHVLSDGEPGRTVIATTEFADRAKIAEIERLGAEVLVMPAASRIIPVVSSSNAYAHAASKKERQAALGVDLKELLVELGRRRMASVLVEGGAGIITAFVAERIADRFVVAIAPKIIGSGLAAIGELGILNLHDAVTFCSVRTKRLGDDIIFDGRLSAITETSVKAAS